MEILDQNGEQSKRLRHRIQIVKGWLDAAGKRNTFDAGVAGSGRRLSRRGRDQLEMAVSHVLGRIR